MRSWSVYYWNLFCETCGNIKMKTNKEFDKHFDKDHNMRYESIGRKKNEV